MKNRQPTPRGFYDVRQYISQTPYAKDMFSSLQGPHQCIQLFIICWIIKSCFIKLLTEIGFGHFSCIKNASIPILEASHSTSKVFVKSSKVSNGGQNHPFF
jgi:hypothetical protein